MAFTTPLFLPFENGGLSFPEGRGLFLNAELPVGIDHNFWRPRLNCVQQWRDRYLQLQRARYEVETTPAVYGKADFAIVTIGKHRAEVEANIIYASEHVTKGAPIVIGGHKRSGAAAIKSWLAKQTELVSSISKHHWQTVVIHAGEVTLEATATRSTVRGFETAPGMFSSEHVDEGSAFLVEALPDGHLGNLADFGCGWGYLSVEAIRACGADSVALVDAHSSSLKSAERNFSSHHPSIKSQSHWLDLTQEETGERYDTILMNPPFHNGGAADPEIGPKFIESAAQHLKPGGVLYAVANRHLPYERQLQVNFKRVETIAESNRYKVFRALR
ncbi:MAG: class I SAM-dependent methyltransferase [Pseudomonadota bacterium]